jgi:hypothetical protein
MVDVDTFLTTLYVIVDDFCQSRAPRKRPAPKAALSDSEVIALAIFARWGRFSSERDFFRYAQSRLREAFPTLPDRSQFNRLVRSCVGLIEEVALHLLALMPDAQGGGGGGGGGAYEALDASAMPVRNAKRRGEGWLAGYADIGWSNSLGWYEGFCLLVAVAPTGVITGFGFASASTKDQPFWPKRSSPCGLNPTLGSRAWDQRPRGLMCSTRALRAGTTTEDGGIDTGRESSAHPSPTGARRGSSGPSHSAALGGEHPPDRGECLREAARDLLGLRGERPHELSGLRARLAARVALHNFCIWLNEQLGRPRLSFVDLLGW